MNTRRMQSLGGGTPALMAVAAHLYTLQASRLHIALENLKPPKSSLTFSVHQHMVASTLLCVLSDQPFFPA